MNEVVLWKKINEKGKVETKRLRLRDKAISLWYKVKDANTQRNVKENSLFCIYICYVSTVSVSVF